MKCAKEVMEQWETSTNEQYKKNLCEVVKAITEDLFTQASNGCSKPPKKDIIVYPVAGGRLNAAEIIFSSGAKFFKLIVFWPDFVEVMESLCYKVSKDRAFDYFITPNPSC